MEHSQKQCPLQGISLQCIDNGSVRLGISCTNSVQEKGSGTIQELFWEELMKCSCIVTGTFFLDYVIRKVSANSFGRFLRSYPLVSGEFPDTFPGRN